MTDLDCIFDFTEFLKNYHIKFKNTDIETLEDDDYGNRLSFYVYYQDPIIHIDLELLKNKYYNESFNLKEIVLKNDELRCKFVDKRHDEQILYY